MKVQIGLNTYNLHDQAKLNLPNELKAEFLIVNSWNIEGRYPDYQTKLFKSSSKEYIDDKAQIILKLKTCLQEILQ